MKILKIVSDLLPIPSYAVIVICFFFPFLTIKCNTADLVSVTGFDYVIGNDIKDKLESSEMAKTIKDKMNHDIFNDKSEDEKGSETDVLEKSKAEEETKDEKNTKIMFFIILSVPLLMAVVGLILSFVKLKRKGLINIVFSSIGLLFLIVYGVVMKSSGDVNSLASMSDGIGAGMISINLGNAYFVACFFFLIIILFFGMMKYLQKLYVEEQEIIEESNEEFYIKDEF